MAMAMLGAGRDSAARAQAQQRVAFWTRERFTLPPEAAVLVSELACSLPGCPPIETVVAFWTLDGTRHHFKVFKPLAQVVPDDLPYAWLMKSLAREGADDCC